VPKVHDNRKKRRWDVTTSSIAAATGKNARVVRADINKGLVSPWDLVSLAQYVLLHAYRNTKPSGDRAKGDKEPLDLVLLHNVSPRKSPEPVETPAPLPPLPHSSEPLPPLPPLKRVKKVLL
jgi:hypothetical protein